MPVRQVKTWYIPDGESAELDPLTVRDDLFLVDDRGTLYMLCHIEQADTDGVMCLKQFDAKGLMKSIEHLERYEDYEGGPIRVDRDGSTYDVEMLTVSDVGDAMGGPDE